MELLGAEEKQGVLWNLKDSSGQSNQPLADNNPPVFAASVARTGSLL